MRPFLAPCSRRSSTVASTRSRHTASTTWRAESLNREDYWHRAEFAPPAELAERTLTLTFGGVNYAADVTYELSALDAKGELRRFELSPTSARGRRVVDKRHASLRHLRAGWVPTFAEGGEASPGVRFLDDLSTAPFLVIRVNGRRIACKGGNWGLDEAMKRVDRERLEPYLRMERDAHLTMIRNWGGQSTEKAFFDLADEYGIMVWNDFWTSTQNWSLQPGDLHLWLANAEDTIKRFRNHPSIVLWCGRNQGVPPPRLNEGLDSLVLRHDGTRSYQPTSNRPPRPDSGATSSSAPSGSSRQPSTPTDGPIRCWT